jgi:hypothetical protein
MAYRKSNKLTVSHPSEYTFGPLPSHFSWTYFFCFDHGKQRNLENLAYCIRFNKINVSASHVLRNSILPDNKAQSCPARNTPHCLRDAVIMSMRPCLGAGIAQSVQRRAMGRTARVRFLAGSREFPLFHISRPALGPTQAPIQCIPGALSLGAKRSEREGYQSPKCRGQEWWIYNLTPQHVLMVWCLIEHRDNFTFSPLQMRPIPTMRTTFSYLLSLSQLQGLCSVER